MSPRILAPLAALFSCLPAHAADPPAGLPGPVVPAGWGVNIHFTDPQPGEMTRFQEAGFCLARMDLFWNRVEKAKGEYDFGAYDRLVEQLARAGARPLFILDYGNDLYQEGSPTTPEAVAAFGRFAQAAAAHYKGKGIIWEIWNEPNGGQFWKPKPDAAQYAAAALAAAKGVRAGDPAAVLVAPGAAGFPWEFLETVFQSGLLQYLDGVSVHPYRGSEPESAAADFARLRALIARYAPRDKRQMPILSSEWGYSTFEGSPVSEERQAQYLCRMWLANLASGVNVSIFYDWKEDGKDPKENEHHFGTVRPDLTPKPAFAAARKLIAALDGYSFRHRLAGKGDTEWRLLFQKSDTDQLAVASWSADRKAPDAAQTPTVRRVAKADADFDGLRKLASIRYPAGPLAVGKGAPAVIRIEVTPLGGAAKPPKLDLRFDVPGEANPFDTHTEKVSGRDVLVTRVEVLAGARRDGAGAFRPRFAWEGKALPAVAPLAVVRTDPVSVAASPGRSGLVVTVSNPTRAPFWGEVRLDIPGAPSVTRQMVVPEGKDYAVAGLPDPGARPFHVSLFESTPNPAGGLAQWAEVARTETVRYLPLAGLPMKAGADSGFQKVLYVENAAQKPEPVTMAAAPPDGPADAAIGINYRFEAGWRYLGLAPSQPLAIPPGAKALTAWVYSDGAGDYLRSRFRDATGQTFQADLGKLEWKGWRLVTIPLDGTGIGISWGGANDGVLHPPLSWESLLLIDSANRERAHDGSVLVAAPAYVLPGT